MSDKLFCDICNETVSFLKTLTGKDKFLFFQDLEMKHIHEAASFVKERGGKIDVSIMKMGNVILTPFVHEPRSSGHMDEFFVDVHLQFPLGHTESHTKVAILETLFRNLEIIGDNFTIEDSYLKIVVELKGNKRPVALPGCLLPQNLRRGCRKGNAWLSVAEIKQFNIFEKIAVR